MFTRAVITDLGYFERFKFGWAVRYWIRRRLLGIVLIATLAAVGFTGASQAWSFPADQIIKLR